MKNWKVKFSNSTVSFVLDGSFAAIDKIVEKTQNSSNSEKEAVRTLTKQQNL